MVQSHGYVIAIILNVKKKCTHFLSFHFKKKNRPLLRVFVFLLITMFIINKTGNTLFFPEYTFNFCHILIWIYLYFLFSFFPFHCGCGDCLLIASGRNLTQKYHSARPQCEVSLTRVVSLFISVWTIYLYFCCRCEIEVQSNWTIIPEYIINEDPSPSFFFKYFKTWVLFTVFIYHGLFLR